jgi:corrinoid protein of di/trimethylamine methyltransferase
MHEYLISRGGIMNELGELQKAIIEGAVKEAERLTRQALDKDIEPLRIFRTGMVPGMEEVGRRMQAGEYYLPEVLISANAMRSALAIIRPRIAQSGTAHPVNSIVIGTVEGDLHDIGKNLVGMMLEGAGFEVTDLGISVSVEQFVEAVREKDANILGLSALLTTTMVNMEKVIEALKEHGERDRIKIMVGGAPVTQRFCDEIGADGYSSDAVGAVKLAKKFLTESE